MDSDKRYLSTWRLTPVKITGTHFLTDALRRSRSEIKRRLTQEIENMAKKVAAPKKTKEQAISPKGIKKIAKLQKKIDRLDKLIIKLSKKKVKLEKKRDLTK